MAVTASRVILRSPPPAITSHRPLTLPIPTRATHLRHKAGPVLRTRLLFRHRFLRCEPLRCASLVQAVGPPPAEPPSLKGFVLEENLLRIQSKEGREVESGNPEVACTTARARAIEFRGGPDLRRAQRLTGESFRPPTSPRPNAATCLGRATLRGRRLRWWILRNPG